MIPDVWKLRLIIAGICILSQFGLFCFGYSKGHASGKDIGEHACIKAITRQCNEDKAITTKVSNDYQKALADLDRQLAALKRLQPSRCVPVARSPGGRDAAPGAGEPGGRGGVDSDRIIDLGARGERYRQQLIACQDFIKRTWDKKQ